MSKNNFLKFKMEEKPKTFESRKFLREFIEIYHTHQCLWKYCCEDYHNRIVKDRAYDALVAKMKEIDPLADRNSVMRKINVLRTAFRREYKKVRKTALIASSSKYTKSVYVPTLWYYEIMKFVVDQQDYSEPLPGASMIDWSQDKINKSYESKDEDVNTVDHDTDEVLIELLEEDTLNPDAEIKVEPLSPVSSRTNSPTIPAVSTSTSGPFLNLEINSVYSEKRNTNYNSNQSNFRERSRSPIALNARQASTKRSQPISREPNLENYDRFGSYVAAKLKRSSLKQSIIAEKVIAEVLMRANLGTLEETTTLTNVNESSSNG